MKKKVIYLSLFTVFLFTNMPIVSAMKHTEPSDENILFQSEKTNHIPSNFFARFKNSFFLLRLSILLFVFWISFIIGYHWRMHHTP